MSGNDPDRPPHGKASAEPAAKPPAGPNPPPNWWLDVEGFKDSRRRERWKPNGAPGGQLVEFALDPVLAEEYRRFIDLVRERGPLIPAIWSHAIRTATYGLLPATVSAVLATLFHPLAWLGVAIVLVPRFRGLRRIRSASMPVPKRHLLTDGGTDDVKALSGLPKMRDPWCVACWRFGGLVAGYNARVSAINLAAGSSGSTDREIEAAALMAQLLLVNIGRLFQIQRQLIDARVKRMAGQDRSLCDAELKQMDPFGDDQPDLPALDWLHLPPGYCLMPTDLLAQLRRDREAIESATADRRVVGAALKSLEDMETAP